MTHSELKDKVKLLPFAPGIYMMKDKNGNIIYVGKSKCLHNRVSHYFQPVSGLDVKTAKLVSNIYDFECIYTSSEAEALILENELIKRHNPKYNIKLKDAKTYPYIKLNINKLFPEISISRSRNSDKSLYYGPYVSSKNANDIIDIICKTFRVASCGKNFEYGKRICRPCLFYHMGQCCAPCSGKISSQNYREIFADIQAFLNGNYSDVIKELENKMLCCAEKMDFENAAKFRDRIDAIKKLREHQNIITDPDKEFDVFGLHFDETCFSVCIIFIRNGKVIDKEEYIFSAGEMVDEYELADFIERFYNNCGHIPKNILLSFDLSDEEKARLCQNLSDSAGVSVKISVPERGEKRIYTEMATRNAAEAIRQSNKSTSEREEILVKLASILKLEVFPQRIEAYDISNNGKDDIYGGMIVIEDGKFKKSNYRTFSIKGISDKQDDYASMKEMLRRRLKYLCPDCPENNESFSVKPDLILLDGGDGHVSSVKEVMRDLGIDIQVVGMIKDEHHKTRTLTDGQNEISIAKDLGVFSFIYGIQEEIHRYTFSKMDSSRNKKIRHSSLERIDGVGEKKAASLMKTFKSLRKIQNSSVEELASVKGITPEIAERILSYLNKEENKL